MEEEFSKVTTLIGDPIRAKIMWALLDGRAYTASELAVYTETSAQNLSMHLAKLVNATLLSVETQGRHKYYNYARPEIAFAIEALANLVPKEDLKKITEKALKPVEYCRTCYDHLAGKVGVLLAESLVERGLLIKNRIDFEVTIQGAAWFNAHNIDIILLKKQKRDFARCCLDWSERKHHLAGSLGTALLNIMVTKDWIRRNKDSRAMTLTAEGRLALYEKLRLTV